MDFQLYYADKAHTRVCAVVTYVCAGSPAAEAGLDRGDVVLAVDGHEMKPDNYRELVVDGILGGGTVTLGLQGGKTVTMTAVDMYENPVHTVRILQRPGGRKVGYLHYTSFTLDSCEELIDVFDNFTREGIDDLVLDLRYNGGGYVVTESVLGSMLAPVAEVTAGSVFYQEIYNKKLAEEMEDEPACFETEFSFKVDGKVRSFSTTGANPDLRRLYVLVTGSSA
jgi:C-terminal processing protease CtpA/Prc